MSLKKNDLYVITLPSKGITTSLNSGDERPLLPLTFHCVVLLLLLGGLSTVTG